MLFVIINDLLPGLSFTMNDNMRGNILLVQSLSADDQACEQ